MVDYPKYRALAETVFSELARSSKQESSPIYQLSDGTFYQEIDVTIPDDFDSLRLRTLGNNVVLGLIKPNKMAWETAILDVTTIEIACAKKKCRMIQREIQALDPWHYN